VSVLKNLPPLSDRIGWMLYPELMQEWNVNTLTDVVYWVIEEVEELNIKPVLQLVIDGRMGTFDLYISLFETPD